MTANLESELVRPPVPMLREGREFPLSRGSNRCEAQALTSGWAFLFVGNIEFRVTIG